jgi:hypothetical protein
MTQTGATVLWQEEVDGELYRLVAMAPGADPPFRLEMRQPADAFGDRGWAQIALPLEHVLRRALAALLSQR